MIFKNYRQKRYMNKLISRRDMEFKIRRLEAEVEKATDIAVGLGRKLVACVNDRDKFYMKSQEQAVEIELLIIETDRLNGMINDLREALSAANHQLKQEERQQPGELDA
jgi:hypothetical protein